MSLSKLPSSPRAVHATKDTDAGLPENLTEPVRICPSVRYTSAGLSRSSTPAKVSVLCNIALSVALIFSLFVSMRQNDTIKDQRQNIFEMAQNPYCTGAPGFRGKSAASPAMPRAPVVQDNHFRRPNPALRPQPEPEPRSI